MDNAEFYKLYSCPNIVRHIKSRRIRSEGLVAHMGEETQLYEVLVVCPKEDHLED
jgi:hypothetical protein